MDVFVFFTGSSYSAAKMESIKEITMSTKNKWITGVGITLGLIVLFFLPSLWQAIFPSAGFGMMGHGNISMMNNYGFWPMRGGMGFGMSFLWLVPLAVITLIGLSIAALIKYLKTPAV